MKFLDYLFHGKELKAIGNYFKMLNGYSPTFTSFSGGVYEMDLTRTAINNFATHCSKLKPEIEGSALKSLEKTLQHTPNALQMQHIQENVCTHFGTNMDILQNKFDENTWNAYYEGKIEPFAIQLSLVMTNMSFTERERACGNAIFFSANRLQYASNATKLSVSTQLFDRALLNRNGVMDIWNMAHVEDGEKYYIRKEYTEVSELHKGSEQPVIIQQVPQQTEPAAGEEPQNGQEEKEGVNNAS